MQTAYEDRVNGKMPEDICLNFIQKYSEEQKTLATEITELEEKLNEQKTYGKAQMSLYRTSKSISTRPNLRVKCATN